MYFVFFFKNIIEYFYVRFNENSIIFKRDFNNLSYFEKVFLAFFYRKNIFNNTIANIFQNNSLMDFRKKKFPLVFFFHLYFDRSNYVFSNLKSLKKYFLFFKNSRIFSKTFNHLKKLFFLKKSYKINNFIIYLIIQKILFKRYYNLCSSIYFTDSSDNNIVKLNWLFFTILANTKGFLKIYDLSKYDDWYNFNFNKNKNNINIFKSKKESKFKPSKIYTDYNNQRKHYIKKIYKKYNFFFKVFIKNYKNINVLNYKNNVLDFLKIKLNKNWFYNLKNYYSIRFSETSLSKHINLNNVNIYTFFFIRKNRIFNKGRYSRNRQLYRTGVYWCLWLNIMLVYGLYFMFYRFTFNFGYFWWGLLIFAYSTIFSRVLKYNFFNIFYIKNEFIMLFKWFGLIVLDVRNFFTNFLNYYVYKNYIYTYILNKNNFMLFFINTHINNILIFLKNLLVFKNYGKFVYFWENLNHKDESFLKYKSVLHWFNQFYKLMTY